MATKDWKKVRYLNYSQYWVKTDGSVTSILDLNRFNDGSGEEGFVVVSRKEHNLTGTRVNFKTNTEALKYAKSYMRSH